MRTHACLLAAAALFLPPTAFGADEAPAVPQSPEVQPSVIYGDDDRLDLWQVQSERLKQLAGSTVALFRASNVKPDAEGETALLATESYAESYNLCKSEPFYDQRTGAFCSGSLVGEDLVMTAGHCIDSEDDCKETKFVFGFGMQKEGQNPEAVPIGEVYGCAALVAREERGNGADWAIVRLDRKAEGHAPLKLNRKGSVSKGAKLFVIGHPAGLPTKVAGGASVRDPGPEGYFTANLDTYGGNSGSAVFNAETGEIEGILVRGETDYEWKDGCRVSKRCEDDGCRGEDVTKVAEVFEHVPPTGAAAAVAAFDKPGPALSSLIQAAGGR